MFLRNPPRKTLYRIKLFGPVQVFDQNGEDVTPRSAKSKGLLAMLVVSGGAPIARSTLESRLWSDRMPKQARSSLKQALSELRRCFHASAEDVIQSDGPVWVNMALVSTDLTEPEEGRIDRPEFLEGLDVRDSEFDDWVRNIRLRLDDKVAPPAKANAPAPPSVPPEISAQRLTIRFTPPEIDPAAREFQAAARAMTSTIQGSLLEQDYFRIIEGDGIGHMNVELSYSRADTDRMRLDLTVRVAHSGEIVLRSMFTEKAVAFTNNRGLYFAVAAAYQITEKCLAYEAGAEQETLYAAKKVQEGIREMFQIGNENLLYAEKAFSQATEVDPRGTYLAWQAYLNAFLYEKSSISRQRGPMWEKTEELARRALEADPANPLIRGLLAHVYGFVRRDFLRANEILDPVADSRPDSLMLQDALALFRFYTGDIKAAGTHAELAGKLGMQSKFRYVFTTTSAMLALVEGKFDEAAELSRRAEAQHPIGAKAVFEPVLRTLTAAQAHGGDPVGAAKTLARIRKQTPGFTPDALESPETSPIPNPEAFHLTKSGLKIADKA